MKLIFSMIMTAAIALAVVVAYDRYKQSKTV